jgi:hypothetical protein
MIAPLLSILIPTYNRATLLGAAFASPKVAGGSLTETLSIFQRKLEPWAPDRMETQ